MLYRIRLLHHIDYDGGGRRHYHVRSFVRSFARSFARVSVCVTNHTLYSSSSSGGGGGCISIYRYLYTGIYMSNVVFVGHATVVPVLRKRTNRNNIAFDASVT